MPQPPRPLILTVLLAAAVSARGQDAPPKAEPEQKAEPSIRVELERPPTAADAASLLTPPGDGPGGYGPKVDWRKVPPWEQTEFFGIRARGKIFIYVVDCSGSMADDLRLIRAKAEVRRSVRALRWPQRFHVIFYNDRPIQMPGGLPQSAEATAKARMSDWFRTIEPEGTTDPRGAMTQALGLRPDAVFLLSDGQFPDGTDAEIAARNPFKVPIHCVDLSGGAGGPQLRRIARDSGGEYRERP